MVQFQKNMDDLLYAVLRLYDELVEEKEELEKELELKNDTISDLEYEIKKLQNDK